VRVVLSRVGAGVFGLYACALGMIELRARSIEVALEVGPVASGTVYGIVFYDDCDTARLARVARGVERLKAGAIDGLVMVGGWRPARSYVGSQVMADEALALGVPAARLRHDANSNDTWSNLRNALRVLQGESPASLELVSDRLHLARITLLLRSLAVEHSVRLVATAEDGSGWRYFARLNHELAAYLFLLLPRGPAEALLVRLR
jgi:uncharacterized SAM-binding protein YcdF (DUF218 family)